MAMEIISANIYSGSSVDPFGNAFSHPEALEVVYPQADGTINRHIIPLMAVADVQNTFGYADPMDAVQHIIAHHEAAASARTAQRSAARGLVAEAPVLDVQQVNADLFAHWSNVQQLVNEQAAKMALDEVEKMVGEVAALVVPPDPQEALQASRKAVADSSPKLVASPELVEQAASSQQALVATVEEVHAPFALETEVDGYQQLSAILGDYGQALADLRQENFDIRYGAQVRGIVAQRVHQARAQKRESQQAAQAALAAQAKVVPQAGKKVV